MAPSSLLPKAKRSASTPSTSERSSERTKRRRQHLHQQQQQQKHVQEGQGQGPYQEVTISQFIPIDEEKDPDSGLSFPCIASFRGCSKPRDIDSMLLSLHLPTSQNSAPLKNVNCNDRDKKRHGEEGRIEGEDGETDGNLLELHACPRKDGGSVKDSREWKGQNGFHEIYSNYHVGIRNKKTGTLKIVQIGGLYSMRPHLASSSSNTDKGAEAAEAAEDDEDNILDDDDEIEEDEDNLTVEQRQRRSYMKKRTQLLQAFGGHKSVSAVQRYNKDIITDAKVDDTTLRQITEAANKMKESDEKQGIDINADETTELSAPPHDNKATRGKDAYPLEALMSGPEWNSLSESVDLFIDSMRNSEENKGEEWDEDTEKDNAMAIDTAANRPLENPGWHPLVWKILLRLYASCPPLSDIGEDMKRQMCCIMHLHFIITLCKAPRVIPSFKESELEEEMGVTKDILIKLLNRFTEKEKEYGKGERRMKSQVGNHQLIQHGVLMWLHAHDFDSNNCGHLDKLAEALNISLKLLLVQATGLGCKVRKFKSEQGTSSYRLSLPLPLKFPLVKTKKLGKQSRKSVV